ncbi:hypothetical protein C7B62_16665 [Pleurocapsa sp. CCALA 161]|uniref:Asr1405/Asl0597 family protein n=1 Tax=Pleurocapsa sp. CCALA 161 TaxID=2107688 RepID=UPI000D055115|nr:Asr1405/Asl0597 family protein [Pleurocapsa sp. CCALA 161]PSB08474.1 hypothetical protein C7B62_16665 [Pleurocapsa sp. CCALA 161]
MKLSPTSHPIMHIVTIKNTERWTIYHRLQELEIPCQCSTNQPVQVELNTPNEIAQLCSVFKQSTASRSELIDWLDDCWRIKSKPRKSKR